MPWNIGQKFQSFYATLHCLDTRRNYRQFLGLSQHFTFFPQYFLDFLWTRNDEIIADYRKLSWCLMEFEISVAVLLLNKNKLRMLPFYLFHCILFMNLGCSFINENSWNAWERPMSKLKCIEHFKLFTAHIIILNTSFPSTLEWVLSDQWPSRVDSSDLISPLTYKFS